MRVLLDRVFLVVVSSVFSLSIYQAVPFWLVEFLLINQLITWWEFPYRWSSSLADFHILSLPLIFVRLITMSLIVFLLGFILPGTLCASRTWLTLSFSTLRAFSAIISSNTFSGSLSLSSSLGTPIMRMLVHWLWFQRSLRLTSFVFLHSFFYILFCTISTILSSRSLIHFSTSVILLLIVHLCLFVFFSL